jgi:hypothetical protein
VDQPAERHAQEDEQAGRDPDLSFQRDGPLSPDDREARGRTGQRPAFDVDGVRTAGRSELFTGLPAAGAGLADDVQWVAGRAGA